jgi:hypothetical protein
MQIEKNDAFNCYDKNPFVKILRLYILDSHQAQVTYSRQCLHLFANQPDYIENMKIFTRKRENYLNSTSRLRIQNRVHPSCLFYAQTFPPTSSCSLRFLHFLFFQHPLHFTQLHNRILCFPKMPLELGCVPFMTLCC